MILTVRLLLLVALAILPALVIEAFNEYSLRQSREAEVRVQAVRLAEQTAVEIRQIIEGIQRVAVTLAQVPLVRGAASGVIAPKACVSLLADLRRDYPGHLAAGVANANNQLVCTSRGITTAQLRSTYVQRAIETGSFVVGGYQEGTEGARYLTFAYPLQNETGPVLGALVFGLDLGWLAEHMRKRFAGVEAVVGLSDRDLTYLMRLPDDTTQLVGKPAPPELRSLAAIAGKGAIEAKGPDGVTRVAAVVPLSISPDSPDKPDLLVAFGLSKDAALEPIRAATTRGIALLIVGLLLALLAAVVGGHYFVRRPVERLLAAAGRWREGDYSARISEADGKNEFSHLGAVFNTVAERIEERTQELEKSEERFRSLASLVPAFVWFADAEGNIRYLNDRWCRYTGQSPEEAMLTGWIDAVHADDAERTLAAWESAVPSGGLYEIEVRYRRQDGVYRWFLARAEPLRNEAGQVTGWFGSSTDIDAIKRGEEHRTLLINELNHRVKNTLATVQSIASQSLRGSDLEQGREAFEARLLALSRTHDVLTRENWESAPLWEIVQEAIRPYQAEGSDRFRIGGPSVRVLPSMALPISMCLHELLTNATKYGAFSSDAGQVTITWRTEGVGQSLRLKLQWQESGGPEVVEPTRKGFGSRLIERSLARELGGEVTILYEPAGLMCSFDVPLAFPGERMAKTPQEAV
jgi:PAS domain S-box-containing protein